MSKPYKPRGLGTAGTRLWETTIDQYQLEDEPHKLELLTQACKVSDKIAELEKAQEGQPLTVLGSARQVTIHPLISEVRFQRGTLATLLGKLGLPDAEESEDTIPARVPATRRPARQAQFQLVK
ncbi:hypothetical protein [Rhodococcus rhodochrous]|uniref:hypothetical protein n=1 Tax=Rhodococcus rhodochrous TaxID=1829 RepID=UPI0024BB7949|nr:hypothetical protein [Rhodococcus rhodochrous]MDJ0400881.1 hypothetical protein [Rhodococcus rhodochrous]